MNKIKLLALACSWILGAMLLIAHPANAAEIVGQITDQFLATTTQNIPARFTKQVSVNTPVQLTAKDEMNSTHHWGCGCSACQNRFEQLQGRLPG
jgi:hypothetical protein